MSKKKKKSGKKNKLNKKSKKHSAKSIVSEALFLPREMMLGLKEGWTIKLSWDKKSKEVSIFGELKMEEKPYQSFTVLSEDASKHILPKAHS
jgi:hypothetical protein